MILGRSTAAFTTLHVVISLIGISSGLVVIVWCSRSSVAVLMAALKHFSARTVPAVV